jgi:hypothetical protein
MSSHEMPIFTRTYDLLSWLLPATNHFPRTHRHMCFAHSRAVQPYQT